MPNLYSKPKAQTRWSSFENPKAKKGAAAHENQGAKGRAFDKIDAGAEAVLLDYSESAGIINRIWITVDNRTQPMLRSLVIRCYWDNAEKPAVEEPDKDALYFHCYWHRVKQTILGKDFEILPKVEGAGRFLGTAVVVNANPIYENQWWGEGEVKAYIDGDTELPTLCGTGTEDYIGTGWGQGTYFNRYQGCLTADPEMRRWVFYRLHIPDPVWFDRDIRFTIQQIGGESCDKVKKLIENNAPLIPVTCDGGEGAEFMHLYKTDTPLPEKGWVNYYRSDDYAAVSWFYLDKKENSLPAIDLTDK